MLNSVKYEWCTLSCTCWGPWDSSFYFLSFSSSYCLGSGAPLQADFRELIQASIRGKGFSCHILPWLKDSLQTEKQTNKTDKVGTPSGFSPAVSVSEGRGWLFSTVSLPADRGPGTSHQRRPTSVMMMRFSLQRADRHPAEGDWRGREELWEIILWLPGSWWLPKQTLRNELTVSSHHREWRQQVGSGWAEPRHRTTYLFHVFPYASSRL